MRRMGNDETYRAEGATAKTKKCCRTNAGLSRELRKIAGSPPGLRPIPVLAEGRALSGACIASFCGVHAAELGLIEKI